MNFRICAGTFHRPESRAVKRRPSPCREWSRGSGEAVTAFPARLGGEGRRGGWVECVRRSGSSSPAWECSRLCRLFVHWKMFSISGFDLELVEPSSAEESRGKSLPGRVNVCALVCVKTGKLFFFFFFLLLNLFYNRFKKAGSVIVSFVPVVAAGSSTSWVYLHLLLRVLFCSSSL